MTEKIYEALQRASSLLEEKGLEPACGANAHGICHKKV